MRERRSDIEPLSDAFLQEIGRSFGRPPAGLTREARSALLRYEWPGNVRELRNVLERAAILCEGASIDTDHLTLQSTARSPRNDTNDLPEIEQALAASHGRVYGPDGAAEALGMPPSTLESRIRRLGIDKLAFRRRVVAR